MHTIQSNGVTIKTTNDPAQYTEIRKGLVMISNTSSKFWNLTEGEQVVALSKSKFINGEHQVNTAKGWLSTMFFNNVY